MSYISAVSWWCRLLLSDRLTRLCEPNMDWVHVHIHVGGVWANHRLWESHFSALMMSLGCRLIVVMVTISVAFHSNRPTIVLCSSSSRTRHAFVPAIDRFRISTRNESLAFFNVSRISIRFTLWFQFPLCPNTCSSTGSVLRWNEGKIYKRTKFTSVSLICVDFESFP